MLFRSVSQSRYTCELRKPQPPATTSASFIGTYTVGGSPFTNAVTVNGSTSGITLSNSNITFSNMRRKYAVCVWSTRELIGTASVAGGAVNLLGSRNILNSSDVVFIINAVSSSSMAVTLNPAAEAAWQLTVMFTDYPPILWA